MTTYYVDYTNGSDSNNGLGPDASHATNKPWKTLGKALGASGIGTAGDTVAVAPGVQRERVTVSVTPTVETTVVGDWTNAYGFKTSSGVRVAPGPVAWSAFETNDTSLPSASAAVVNLNGKSNLTFKNILFVSGRAPTNGSCVDATTATSSNITFNDCDFFGPGFSSFSTTAGMIRVAGGRNVALVWRFNRCIFFSSTNATGIVFVESTPDTADFDIDVQVNNCLFHGMWNRCIYHAASSAGVFKAGGINVNACTFSGCNTAACATITTTCSTSIPMTVNNCLIMGNSGLVAATSGQITSDYCINTCSTRTTLVTPTNTNTDGALAIAMHFGQFMKRGGYGRFPFTPFLTGTGSGLTGFGAGSSPPSTDILNRVRPSGAQSLNITPGCVEIHDYATQETTVVDVGSNAIKLTGPGDARIQVPVDATATVLAIRVRYDTTHGTTNKPQAILEAQDAIGVATQTVTATVGVDTWETLTFASITPTSKGLVTITLKNRAAAGGGIAYFDTVTAS